MGKTQPDDGQRRSGSDATIESGKYTERYPPMIQRLEPIYGQMPTGSRQTVVMPARPICMKRRLWA